MSTNASSSKDNKKPKQNGDAFVAWVESRSKDFEMIAQKRNVDTSVANRALKLVRKFIIERKLILYGGQAIDYALRLRGSGIYPAHQTPDFDFFSPQNVDDAYDLADILQKAGFENVGAIPAIHVQTMRVKVDFIFVADISFAPQSVFDSLPTVSYGGMSVLHPDYQRTDMHLAFCFPFNGPPREDVFHRFGKDQKRLGLLERYYPITTGKALSREISGGTSRASVVLDLSHVAVHGFAAYGLLLGSLRELFSAALAAGIKTPDLTKKGVPLISVAVGADEASGLVRLEFEPPSEVPRLVLASPWPEKVVPAIAATRDAPRVEWFAPYMDSRPAVATISGGGEIPIDVYSTENRLLAITVVRAPSLADSEPARVSIVSPQYLLLYFLYEAHIATGSRRDIFVRYYKATADILSAARSVIKAMRSEKGGPKVSDDVFCRFVESSPFGLTVQTIGDANFDNSYRIRLARSVRAVKKPPRLPPRVQPATLPDLANLPTAYYPGSRARPTFDYDANLAFQRSGHPIEPPIVDIFAEPKLNQSTAKTKRMIKKGGTSSKRTFLAMLEELDADVLTQILKNKRWAPVSFADAKQNGVDLVIADGKYNWDRRLWYLRTRIKSRIKADILTNKVNLHVLLSASAPKTIAKTFVIPTLKDKSSPPKFPGGVWIWRPEGGWAKKGVKVVDSQKALDAAWKIHTRESPRKRALLSKYIAPPALLSDGRKFHLRFYFLVVVTPEEKRTGLYRLGEIAHSQNVYQARDYDSFETHVTRFTWSEELRFPRDYPKGVKAAKKVFSQTLDILAQVSKLALDQISAYEECESGFEILGCDFMVDANGRVFLIEINFKPGYKRQKGGQKRRAWLSTFLFEGLAEFALEPQMKNKKAHLTRVAPCFFVSRAKQVSRNKK